jgi:prepilin-type N-terminal cleavage/methylation domain-containing protein
VSSGSRRPVPPRRTDGAAGFSLLELLVVLALAVVLFAIAVPQALAGADEHRTRAAARYLAGRMFLARLEAIKRSQRIGFRFEAAGADWRFVGYADANGNGIRSSDIARRIDPMLWPEEMLSRQFRGVRLGVVPGVPLIDGEAGQDPVRVGSSRIVTFNPNGSSSSGTLYVRGARRTQYAVRLFGVTGRTRVFRYDLGTVAWKPQ